MGLKSLGRAARETKRLMFNVPNVSGAYANERITFGGGYGTGDGPSGSAHTESNNQITGLGDQDFAGITIQIEHKSGDALQGFVVELWLRRCRDSNGDAGQMGDADFFHSGQVIAPVGTASSPAGVTTSFGSLTYALSGWPGMQVRIKSGGFAGQVRISASAF